MMLVPSSIILLTTRDSEMITGVLYVRIYVCIYPTVTSRDDLYIYYISVRNSLQSGEHADDLMYVRSVAQVYAVSANRGGGRGVRFRQ
jgi:hypothetical protein